MVDPEIRRCWSGVMSARSIWLNREVATPYGKLTISVGKDAPQAAGERDIEKVFRLEVRVYRTMVSECEHRDQQVHDGSPDYTPYCSSLGSHSL